MEDILKFYKGKRVFLTGHTGFKGVWMCKILTKAGAIVTGYSLEPPTNPSLYEIAGVANDIRSIIGDIRDYDSLKKAFDEAQPEIVLHLAAQPIVRDSYKDPVYTYETNVMGTVNILECVNKLPIIASIILSNNDLPLAPEPYQIKILPNFADGAIIQPKHSHITFSTIGLLQLICFIKLLALPSKLSNSSLSIKENG